MFNFSYEESLKRAVRRAREYEKTSYVMQKGHREWYSYTSYPNAAAYKGWHIHTTVTPDGNTVRK